MNNRLVCSHAGFLPIPLRCVPVETLANLEIYLQTQGKYSLYNAMDNHFGSGDLQRLLEAKIEYVYVSVKDHQNYYHTMENAIQSIVADSEIQQEKKAEILYATSLELTNQLLSVPPGKEDIKRAVNLSRATVQLIMKDEMAFGGLYDIFNHDFYTATHLVNVCGLTVSLAQKMGMGDIQILQQIGTGGLLHDIGKIFIPNDILNTTEPLSPPQFELVKTHVSRGCEHLEKVMNLTPEILAVIAQHHERMDGSGYPKGLRRDAISPMGRLAGIVDTFDAMTSVRPYRSHTFTIGESLQKIKDDTPAKYDGEIFHAFASMIEKAVSCNQDDKIENPDAPKGISLSIVDVSGPKYTQYYFRIPIIVKNLCRVGGKLTMGLERKLIAHKITCLSIGFLSDRPFRVEQNIYISNRRMESIGLSNLVAVVSNCTSHNDGWYTVEAQFLTPQLVENIEKLKTITSVREVSPLEVH